MRRIVIGYFCDICRKQAKTETNSRVEVVILHNVSKIADLELADVCDSCIDSFHKLVNNFIEGQQKK